MGKVPIFLAILLILCGCQNETPPSAATSQWQEIHGRDEGDGIRQPIYRVKTPKGWIRHDPLTDESIFDTTKSLCEFIIFEDPESIVRISLHNFPTEDLEQRIPPQAQIARWKQQFETLYTPNVIPQAFAGYAGLLFTGFGTIKGQEVMVMGWAMQLDERHYRSLSNPANQEEAIRWRQMRGDFTIKAVGPKNLLEKHHEDLILFARSFELLEEIPSHL